MPIDKKYLSPAGRIKAAAPRDIKEAYYVDKLSDEYTYVFPELIEYKSYIEIHCKKHGYVKSMQLTSLLRYPTTPRCTKCRK